jgi:chromosome segregation ATPase
VLKLISWKHSFERLNEEYEMTKKKKQALDNLLNAGKISQSTYDLFNNKIDEAIAETERQQRALLEKMNSKVGEFEQHIKTLEVLLANFEIKHVTGEVDEEVYQREASLLSTGLDASRQELDTAREAINQLSSNMPIPTTDIVVPQEVEPQTIENVETPQPEVASVEETVSEVESEGAPEEVVEQNLPEPPVESVEGGDSDTLENPQETSESEETQSMETIAEGEETQE